MNFRLVTGGSSAPKGPSARAVLLSSYAMLLTFPDELLFSQDTTARKEARRKLKIFFDFLAIFATNGQSLPVAISSFLTRCRTTLGSMASCVAIST